MIDISELRRLAQDATPGPWYVRSGNYDVRNIYSANAITDSEGFTFQPVIATVEDIDVPRWWANARLIAAANPAAISELLNRLEAAEEERDALRAKIAEMEKQEPVGQFIQHPSNGLWEQDGYGDNPDARPLYALPGAKGE